MRARQLNLFLIALSLAGLTCDEPFPVYEEPENVLSAELVLTSPDTTTIVRDSSGSLLGQEPLMVVLRVTNRFNQLLQGEALISGRVNIVMTSPVVRVFETEPLLQSMLARPPVFQQTIALPPGESAEFRLSWIPRGLPFFLEGVPFTETMLPDSTIVQRFSAVTFHAEGDVRIFERVQHMEIPAAEFSVRYTQIFLHK